MIEIERLLRRRPRNATALAKAAGLSVATVWRRIRELRRRGVPVAAVRRGRSGWEYRLQPLAGRAPADLPFFSRRPRDADKTRFGRVLVVAGSYGMAGAAVLACRAAHRTGAGLVYLATPEALYPALAPASVETVFLPQPGRVMVRRRLPAVLKSGERCDVAAIGPGLGRDPGTVAFVESFVRNWNKPLVIDADAIQAVGRARNMGPTRILTPHEGELSRLIGVPLSKIHENREHFAIETARRFGGCVVVLKGRGTVVTNGRRVAINPTGNPGMATAGAGDVLTGIIAALLGEKFEPLDAARLGAWLHGRAGDLAAAERGEVGLVASDLIESLPRAIRERRR